MQQLLRAANAPPRAIVEVPDVVGGCLVCKDWRKPPPHTVTSVRLTLDFNEEVQFDLWFYHSLIDQSDKQRTIAHLLDVCIRYAANALAASKEEIELLTIISRAWIAVHGAMQVLTLDGETGMRGRAATDWAEANHIHLKFKAPHQKAWVAERHQELHRHALHTTESQMRMKGSGHHSNRFLQRSLLHTMRSLALTVTLLTMPCMVVSLLCFHRLRVASNLK